MYPFKLRSLLTALCFLVAIGFATALPAAAQTPEPPPPVERRVLGGQTIVGSSFALRANETIEGDLLVYGGDVVLEPGSEVRGDLAVYGGKIDVGGRITGKLLGVGGQVILRRSGRLEGEQALVGAELVNEGGYLSAKSTQLPLPPQIVVPSTPKTPVVPESPAVSFGRIVTRVVSDFFGFLFSIAVSVGLAVAVMALAPKRVGLIEKTALENPALTGVMGVLTLFAVPLIALLLAITLCGIPLSVALMLGLAVVMAFGFAVASRWVGERMMVGFQRRDWSTLGQTAVGALTLSVLGAIPVLGWLIQVGATCFGMGATVITRLGGQPYVPAPTAPAKPSPVAAVAAPAPPAEVGPPTGGG